MAETRPGGYYIGSDGVARDAHGNQIELDVKHDDLPAGFPGRVSLVAAGHTDMYAVGLVIDDLESIPGIGKATAARIRELLL